MRDSGFFQGGTKGELQQLQQELQQLSSSSSSSSSSSVGNILLGTSNYNNTIKSIEKKKINIIKKIINILCINNNNINNIYINNINNNINNNNININNNINNNKNNISYLFTDILNCIQTQNIQLKKLIYLFFIYFAKFNQQVSLLAVNSFRKDLQDPNPLLRALALRTMGSIRLEVIGEYLLDPLLRAAVDTNPYVRKTAAIAIAKLYDIKGDMIEGEQLIVSLIKMLGDSNPIVVSNAVAALMEIQEADNPLLIQQLFKEDESVVPKLLTALNECTEWGQVFILDALIYYNPPSSSLAESTIDRITARLSHANPAVVLSAVKVILKLLDKVKSIDYRVSIHRKLSPPLITLLSSEEEIQFVVLKNIQIIIQYLPNLLTHEVKMFFCKFNDPLYIKIEKLNVLVKLTTERNLDAVLAELREYAQDVDYEMARRSIKAIGCICMRINGALIRCMHLLLEIINHKTPIAIQECLLAFRDIFRKYPGDYSAAVAAVCEVQHLIDDPEAKAAFIWICGQYSEHVPNINKLLEELLDRFIEETNTVKLQIINFMIKLFLFNPFIYKQQLTYLLRIATEEVDNPDVRDRAFIYWRMLSCNPEATRKIVFAATQEITTDTQDELDHDTLKALIGNISMVASVYHKLPETFVTRTRPAAAAAATAATASSSLLTESSSRGGPPGAPDLTQQPSVEETQQQVVDRARKALEQQQQQQQRNSPRSSSSSSSSRSRSRSAPSDTDSSSDEGGPVDLLDLSDSSASAASSKTCPVPQVLVLNADTPGAQQQKGLEIHAAFHKPQGGSLQLYITATNKTGAPLTGFAIQFNKNSFGLAPGGPLSLPSIPPGESAGASLSVLTGQLNSNLPPTAPLFIQMAIKCSIDIFYFSVPYSLIDVLQDKGEINKELFRQQWQTLGEAKQGCISGSLQQQQQQLTPQETLRLLKPCRLHLVAQRAADTFDALYLSAITTNNLLVLIEVSLPKNNNNVNIAIRTDAAPLVPLFESLLLSTLGLSPAVQTLQTSLPL